MKRALLTICCAGTALLLEGCTTPPAVSLDETTGWLPGQDRHPGNPGENAPGGEVVSIPLPDLAMYGVLYRPTAASAEARLPAVILLHGWTPYNVPAAEAYTYAASEYADSGFVALQSWLLRWRA